MELKTAAKQKAQDDHDLLLIQSSMRSLQQELRVCRDDLFRLQPVVQIPDADVVSEYNTLTQQISNWVDNEIVDFERRQIGEVVPNMQTVAYEGDSVAANLLKRLPKAADYMVGTLVHSFLQENMLGGHIYCFGLSRELSQTLRETEDSMANLKPPRGISARTYHTLKSTD